jgi:hypothetical protein
MHARTIVGSALLVTLSGPALAYVGPGAGLSVLGAFWGLVVAVIAALGFVIVWPFRRLLRRRRSPGAAATPGRTTHATAATDTVSKKAA